jgi:hypothetical protein
MTATYGGDNKRYKKHSTMPAHISLRAPTLPCAALSWTRIDSCLNLWSAVWKCDDCGYEVSGKEAVESALVDGKTPPGGPYETDGESYFVVHGDLGAAAKKSQDSLEALGAAIGASVGAPLTITPKTQLAMSDWVNEPPSGYNVPIEKEKARLIRQLETLRGVNVDVCADCGAEFSLDLDEQLGIPSNTCAVCPTGRVCHRCAPSHTCFVDGEFGKTKAEVLPQRRRTVSFDD